MPPRTSLVPQWVRTLTCVTGTAVVPGILVSATFGATVTGGVAMAVVCYAIFIANRVFPDDRERPTP